MKLEGYPGVSSMKDRHGKIRWRYRKRGQKSVMLKGEPGTPEFEESYEAAITGRAQVVAFPGHPQSLKAAYRLLKKTPNWISLDDNSRSRYAQIIERILLDRINGLQLGDGPIVELRRKHVNLILSRFSHTPHMERLALICLRKLIETALDAEWIEYDPSHGIKRTPLTEGHKAWPAHIMEQYESYWPIGSRQRVAYALALWLGNRVSDVARLEWGHLTTKHMAVDGEMLAVEGFEFVQFKGRKKGRAIFLPMTRMLEKELAPLSRETETVLVSARGTAYHDGSITQAMADWCKDAGIPPGYTMHGLRKALGVKLAEADASTRQLMEVLGHSSIAHAELYSREASQMRLAMRAMGKLADVEDARRKPALKVVK